MAATSARFRHRRSSAGPLLSGSRRTTDHAWTWRPTLCLETNHAACLLPLSGPAPRRHARVVRRSRRRIPTASVLRKCRCAAAVPRGRACSARRQRSSRCRCNGRSFAGFVAEASHRFALPVSSIRAVMQAESGGEVRALSPKGAMGLMQIMPETWAELRPATVWVRIPMILTTTSWRGRPTCGSCTIAMASAASWPPTMPVQVATKSTCDRPAAAVGDARLHGDGQVAARRERLAEAARRCCIMGIELAVS